MYRLSIIYIYIHFDLFHYLQHDNDHIAASFATFKCQDIMKTTNEIQLEIFPGKGEPWGRYWVESESCPPESAICGLYSWIFFVIVLFKS
jgi:hypothetical protein